MNSISKFLAICCTAVLISGCEEPIQTRAEIIKQIDATGTITDAQAEILSKALVPLELNELTSITDEQAEILSKAEVYIKLDGVTSITNEQAESLSKTGGLFLGGLKSISNGTGGKSK